MCSCLVYSMTGLFLVVSCNLFFSDQPSIFGGYNQLDPLLLLQALHRSYLFVFNKPVDRPTVWPRPRWHPKRYTHKISLKWLHSGLHPLVRSLCYNLLVFLPSSSGGHHHQGWFYDTVRKVGSWGGAVKAARKAPTVLSQSRAEFGSIWLSKTHRLGIASLIPGSFRVLRDTPCCWPFLILLPWDKRAGVICFVCFCSFTPGSQARRFGEEVTKKTDHRTNSSARKKPSTGRAKKLSKRKGNKKDNNSQTHKRGIQPSP